MSEINLHNMDCMKYMAGCTDNQFDLAIVDIPYGINQGGSKNSSRGKLAVAKDYKDFGDKKTMPKEYFTELFRVSKNQIIWGANHFISNMAYNSSCWVVWDKDNGANDFADCELAWTSFKSAVRKFKFTWNGMIQEDMKNKQARIHPTEKPVQLYKWLLKNYAKENDKILDTHGGSMSLAIACSDMNFDLEIMELDKDYFEKAKKRFEKHTQQVRFF